MAKLSQEATDYLLHLIAQFDRERGIPHNYFDLETVLKKISFEVKNETVEVVIPNKD